MTSRPGRFFAIVRYNRLIRHILGADNYSCKKPFAAQKRQRRGPDRDDELYVASDTRGLSLFYPSSSQSGKDQRSNSASQRKGYPFCGGTVSRDCGPRNLQLNFLERVSWFCF